MPDLFHDYLDGNPALAPFFRGMPAELFAAPASQRSWDPDLVNELQGYQIAVGARAMVTGNEAAIVTGQQAGLLTGPLYTIYKAITAILLARQLEARFNVPYLPVFWVHTDDHDFDEVASATLLTKNHDLLDLRYVPEASVEGLPIGGIPVEPSLHVLIDRATQAAQGSEFRNEIRAFLHESLDASRSYAEWMARIMARLFQGTPLAIFSPELPSARRIAAPVFARELDNPTATTALARHTEEQLTALGYTAQVSKRPDECSFFLIVEGRRCKVEYRNERFVLPEMGLTLELDELRRILVQEPERFSANVLLRGVVQQTLMPVAAYVGGPGEVAYWSQLREIFARHDASMPVVYPRVRATLTSAKTKKLAEELGVTPDDLLGNPDAAVERALRSATKTPEMDYLRAHRLELENVATAFSEKLGVLSPVAGSMGAALARTVQERLDEMERTLAREDEARRVAIEKQLQRLQHTLAPHRKSQERVLNAFSFLFAHGWELVPRLLQELDVQTMTMQEIEL